MRVRRAERPRFVETIFLLLGHYGAFRGVQLRRFFSKREILGDSGKSATIASPLFTCQRTLSTNNGRAARQGDQWRNIFSTNRIRVRRSTKKHLFLIHFSI